MIYNLFFRKLFVVIVYVVNFKKKSKNKRNFVNLSLIDVDCKCFKCFNYFLIDNIEL